MRNDTKHLLSTKANKERLKESIKYLMKIPDKFKTLTDDERRVYTKKRVEYYQKKYDFWKWVSRTLSANKDFTPLEMEIIETVLEKEYPTVKDYSNVKIEGNNGDPKLVKK